MQGAEEKTETEDESVMRYGNGRGRKGDQCNRMEISAILLHALTVGKEEREE